MGSRLQVNVSREDLERWKGQAWRERLSLSAWVRRTLDRAVTLNGGPYGRDGDTIPWTYHQIDRPPDAGGESGVYRIEPLVDALNRREDPVETIKLRVPQVKRASELRPGKRSGGGDAEHMRRKKAGDRRVKASDAGKPAPMSERLWEMREK